MKKLIALGLVVLVAACADAATEPTPDPDPLFGATGADVVNEGEHVQGCFTAWPGVLDVCLDYRYTINEVETPSGNHKFTYREHGTTIETWYVVVAPEWPAAGTHTYDYRYHFNFLMKNGTDHTVGWNDRIVHEYPDGTICTATWHFHFANGKVTKDIEEDIVCK
jgi:hypothetical protein